MAVPNVPDLARLPVTNHAAGSNANPLPSPWTSPYGGVSSFRRLNNSIVPVGSGDRFTALPFTGSEFGFAFVYGAIPASGTYHWLWLCDNADGDGYFLRAQGDSNLVELFKGTGGSGAGNLGAFELPGPPVAGHGFGLLMNADGLAAFHTSSFGGSWDRIITSPDVSHKAQIIGAGYETNAGTGLEIIGWQSGELGPAEPLDLTANPGAFHYSWNVEPDLSWGEGTMVVVQDWGARKFTARLQALREQDCEVYEYVMPTSDYPWDDGTNNGVPERVAFYGQTGDPDVYRRSDIPVEYYWDPSDPDRIYDPAYNGRCMDMRKNSAWVNHLLAWFRQRVADPNWRLDGWELDVTGTGYMGNWWEHDPGNPEANEDGYVQGFPAAEVAAYREGIVDFVERLRAIVGPEAIFICNNSWDPSYLPEPGTINGVIIENHPQGNIPYWRDQQLPLHTPPLGRPRNFSISPNKDDMFAWAQVPLVTHAGYTGEDHYIVAVPLPYEDDGTGTTFDARPWPEEWNHIHMWEWTDPGPDPPGPAAPSGGALKSAALVGGALRQAARIMGARR